MKNTMLLKNNSVIRIQTVAFLSSCGGGIKGSSIIIMAGPGVQSADSSHAFLLIQVITL